MPTYEAKSRVLIKDGKWQVPVDERPPNWKSILNEDRPVSDESILAQAIQNSDTTPEPTVEETVEPELHCSIDGCDSLVDRMRFVSEDGERMMGLCDRHSEMSGWFSGDCKSPAWIARKYNVPLDEVLEAIRVEITGLWIEHRSNEEMAP